MSYLVDRITTATFWILAALLIVNNALAGAERTIRPNSIVADQSLIKYILRKKFTADPEVVTTCFNTYLPIISENNENFMETYQKCSSDADARANAIDETALMYRRQIELGADGVCVGLDACANFNEPLRFFTCYAEQANNVLEVIYELTQNASASARDLRDQYFTSEAEKYKCQNASQRAYVESTAKIYKDLDICLRGGGNSPTDTTKTTATTPATTEITGTSDPPITTTEMPSTLSPYEPVDPNEPKEYRFDRNLKILPHLRKFYVAD